MAKIKKAFDRESMYKKIMPTNIKRIDVVTEEAKGDIDIPNQITSTKETSLFQNKELNLIKEEKDEVILYNLTEKLVLEKLDAALKKMNCCKCDRCKADIVAITLNNLKPMYVVTSRENINKKIDELKEAASDVTREVIKSVLVVRKNPRH